MTMLHFVLIRMQRDHFGQSKSTTRQLSSICAIEKRRGQLALLTNQHSLRLDRAVRLKCDVYADCSQRRPVLTIFASQSPALEPGQRCGSISFGHLPVIQNLNLISMFRLFPSISIFGWIIEKLNKKTGP